MSQPRHANKQDAGLRGYLTSAQRAALGERFPRSDEQLDIGRAFNRWPKCARSLRVSLPQSVGLRCGGLAP